MYEIFKIFSFLIFLNQIFVVYKFYLYAFSCKLIAN
jgi:hypothetical protein